jgi:hypothetical protein
MSRELKLTPELQNELVQLIEAGNYPDVAAEAVGIGRATFFRWRKFGKDGDERYAAFETAITRAIAAAETGLIRDAKAGDEKGESFGPAKAALEILQRRFSRRWSAKVTHEIADMTAKVLDVVRRVCSESDYVRVLEELAREDGEGPAPEHPGDQASPVH